MALKKAGKAAAVVLGMLRLAHSIFIEVLAHLWHLMYSVLVDNIA
jgi:hypothetical protein